MKFLFVYLLLLASVVLPPSSVSAIGVHTLRVAPSVSEIALDPGASTEKRMTTVNRGDVPFDLQISIVPYSVINEQYEASFEPLPGRVSVEKWISLSTPKQARVEPGKTFDVSYKVSVPAGTPAGGYSAAVLVESTADKQISTGIVAKHKIAHIVYITVNGDMERKGFVDLSPVPLLSFSTSQSLIYNAGNQGGTNEKVKITSVVSDIFGRQMLSDTTERFVLPGTKREMSTAWTSQGVLGIYKIEQSYAFAGKASPASTHWSIIIHPIFVLLALILVVGTMWLNKTRLRTKKERHVKK